MNAMVDSEVDPWGNKRLREHLNRMWYGQAEEPAAAVEQNRPKIGSFVGLGDQRGSRNRFLFGGGYAGGRLAGAQR